MRLFQPKYRLSHPETYVFSLSKKHFPDQSIHKNTVHNFENRSTAAVQALDLLGKMLVFDPAKRITVSEALAHPYLASLHDVNDEPLCPHGFDVGFENELLTASDARRMILEECISFHPRLCAKLSPIVESLRRVGSFHAKTAPDTASFSPHSGLPSPMSMSSPWLLSVVPSYSKLNDLFSGYLKHMNMIF